jgi:hypothetical protein
MTEQREAYKNFLEDLARIWLEYLIVHSVDGVNLEEVVTDPMSGEEVIQLVNVPQTVLEQLQASVKIDITPKGVYDKFAQEQTLENLLTQGFFSAQRLSELETYVDSLDDDSVAPKQKLQEIVKRKKDEQKKIAMIQAQAQAMQQRFQQFMMEDPDGQAQQLADAQMMLQNEQRVMAAEEQLPEPTEE